MYGVQETYLRTKDGLVIYDFDQFFSTTMALAGTPNYSGEIDINNLPDGFKWVYLNEVELLLSI
jgi:hypothetical protein